MTGEARRSARSALLTRQRRRGRSSPETDTDIVADADLSRLVQSGDPARADTKSVVAMQRYAGNRATAQWLAGGPAQPALQRDLTKKVTAPKWTMGRPSSVKAIDTTLGLLVDQIVKGPGEYDKIKALFAPVTQAIAGFRASKDATGKWASAVSDLESEVKNKEAEIDAKIDKRKKGEERHARFETLEPELAQYAKRQMFVPSQFEDDAAGPSIRSALAGPRAEGGGLTPEAIDEMTKTQAPEIAKETQDIAAPTFAGLSVDQVRTFMDAHKNLLTGKTMYPELKNITDPSANPDAVVTTSVDIGGVTMQVEHNASDVNFTERLQLVKDAVAKVTSAGVKLPPLRVHLPKYGREIKLKATDTAPGGECEIGDKSSRAVFVPPNLLHVSSELIGTPDMQKVKNPVTGQDEYKFSSTGFDPSGVASVVHEFGHVLHFTQAPGKFHGLFGSSFTGKTASGKQSSEVANSEVSQYGGKPREFVAEVFLGLIYGKTYSDDVMQMYKAFGGPLPPAVQVKAAVKAL